MGLAEYKRKRDFAVTPEPKGAARKDRSVRSFVIQKHAASHLHYDFRLELEGVLKSWAIPKGPSLDPKDKRLAMETEDHPLEYADFEGIIPAGQYGGGTVVVWDRGTWAPVEDPHKGYRAGRLKFTLDGEKLHGLFTLVKTKGRDARDRSWLFFKDRDSFARPGAKMSVVEKSPKSVVSGRTVEEIAEAKDRVWHSNRAAVAPELLEGARKAALPAFVAPQLPTLVAEPVSGDEWLHEMKLDGYRILCRVERGEVKLLSRNGKDWTASFPGIVEAARALPTQSALLDGEAAAMLPDGTTSFNALQNAFADAQAQPVVYFAFDLLHLDGRDLCPLPLERRKEALRALLDAAPSAALRYSDHVTGSGAKFFALACERKLEGVVSKKRTAPYAPGRGRTWIKVKCHLEQEFVIAGFTEPEGSRVGIGALLLGVHDGERLRYAGKVGTGFTQKVARELRARLDGLEQKTCPFERRPAGLAGAHWVKPELVAVAAFAEWTPDGRLRHPSFRGLREDKSAREVVREKPEERPGERPKEHKAAKSPDEPSVAGVALTHADRAVYPDAGITKLDLARYYEAVIDAMLPHLVDRPTTLVRCPEGLGKPCFYQKHTGWWAPESLRRAKIPEQKKVGEYLIADDLAGVVGFVQIGILEIHTWNSVLKTLERPDRLVFDLDPDEGLPWKRVVEAALLVRERLKKRGLASFVKTTGGKGLHVVTPLEPDADWDACAEFSREVCVEIESESPDAYTSVMSKARRKGKVFLDYLRNVRGATSVCAYSTRAKPGAPVSVPIAWDELDEKRASVFTVASVPKRLARVRDPWAAYERSRRKLPR